MSSEESSSRRSSSSDKTGGWFHSLKKTIQKTTHNTTPQTSDPEFEVAKENFVKLHDTVFRLRDKLNNYIQHAYGLFSNSNGAALDIASLLEDSATPHPYSNIIPDVKLNHAKLVGEKETALAHLLSEECLLKLDTEIELYKELNKRIGIRGEMLSELDYYVQKVDGLKKERDDKLTKGKDEKPAEVEKFERNIQKMEQKKNDFTAYNATVVVDMTTCYRNRVLLLGPVLASFCKVEKELVKFYGEAMNGIRLVDEKEAAAGMNRIRSSSQEQAAGQLDEQQRANPILNTSALVASQQTRRQGSIDRGQPSTQSAMIGGAAPLPPPLPPQISTTSASSAYPNPLSGMNNTPAGSSMSKPAETSMGGEPETEKVTFTTQVEKRMSGSGPAGGMGLPLEMEGKKDEPNPFESSLEAQKRNSAVFQSGGSSPLVE